MIEAAGQVSFESKLRHSVNKSKNNNNWSKYSEIENQ